MKRILSTLTLLLCFAFTAVNAQDNYNATTMGEKVYLETANWGQNSPFNKQIFTSYGGSTNAKAGCVPTAYAIVMRYHGFPTEGTAKTLYNCQAPTYVEITDRVYDFSKMPLTNGSNWTEEQQAETSKFFSHVLHACFPSKIGTGSTEVNEGQTSKVLNDYFNYQLINASYQANFTMEQWIEKIKESIDNGCPIPYASDNSGTGDTRHMFVLDGYTANNYFHFNFGWNGSGNGWFKLDAITPSQGDNYSWIDGAEHYALFNLAPNNTMRTVTATANDSNMGTVSINGGTVGTTASAEINEDFTATLTAHPAQGYALANWTKNGVVVGTKNTLKVKVGASDNDYVANFDDEANVLVEKDCTFNISSVEISGANGSYCSTWTTSDGIVLSCSKGSEPAYALSTTVNTFFAKAPVGNSETLVSDITYTLTAPAGYIIKSYSFKGNSPSSSYTIDVTVGGNTTNVTNASAGVVISASDINAQSTSFVLSSTYVGRAGLAILENGVTVTIQSEGGGSTPTPDPEPEPDPTPTTYAVTTTANPAAGGTAKFAVGTGSQKTQGDVENGTEITLYAVANTGYNFVNWTLGGNVVSTDATCNVNVAQAANYVANFEAEANEPEYPEPTGATYQNNYLTSVTTTGANENISYTANTHPGNKVVTLPGTVRVEQGKSFTLNLVAKSLSSSTSSVYEDMRYCHASLFTDFDGDRTFGAAVQTWGSKKPSNNVAGNYSSVMNITHEITVPAEAPLGTSHVRMIYTNAWTDWPTDGTAVLDKGIVYDIVVEVVEPSNEKTLNVTFGELWSASEVSQIVTKDSPAITITEVNGANKIGYSTRNSVKYPFLLKGGQFTISVPAPYKIASYTLNAECVNFNAGTVEYSNGIQSTTTATIVNGQNMLSASGLNNSEIIINVGNAQAATAGIVVTSLEITYVEEEFTPLPFKAEVDGWRNDNPNTHLGTITIGGAPMKLTPEHLTASELTMPVVEGTTLAFTRKYRGFEFNGFYIGATSLGTNPTLTADNVAAINETTPLVAKFTATDDVTLFYDDDEFSYRIPAIAKTGTNRLIAVSDYRHSHDDIGRDNHGTGTNRVDLVMRTSDDNGATWTAKQTIAEGTSTFGYGDAAIAANGQDILVMAVAGNVFYPNANATNKNKTYRIYSNNNGQSWTKEEVTSNIFGLFDEAYATFFGSGKLAVDPDFNGTGKARVYGAILLKNSARTTNNYVLYSDDWGATWNILGGSKTHIAEADEPKVEILPNGQILLSSRHASGGSRVFNVFTYGNDKAAGEGTWDTAVSGCSNGGKNGTNGEIICLDAKQTNGKPTKILLQSQPQGGSSTWDRKDVTIWYKEIGNETQTPSSIASGWTMGKQVSTVQSAYSAMALQENGEIAFFFEEAPCHNDDNTYGYSMVYVPLTIEEITNNNFLNPNADVEYVPVEFNIVLTDAQDNEYRETIDYIPNNVAAVESYLTTTYPFITLGTTGAIADNKYTNTVTLPFKVSNAENTYWHNIYFPAYDNAVGYPVYMMAQEESNLIKIIAERKDYGASQYNTLAYADELGWAIYSVNNTLTFKFKNQAKNSYIKTTTTATSDHGGENVQFTDNIDEATAFSITDGRSNTYRGEYGITSGNGCICVWSYSDGDLTYTTNNTHQGAWVKFVEAPDYQAMIDALAANVAKFGAGDGNYTDNKDINAIKAIIENIASTPLNTLNTHTETVQTVKESYREVVLTVNETETSTTPGSVSITVNGSAAETVNNKFVPANATVSILATANPGYRFVNWTRPAAQASAAARTAEARNSDVVSSDNPYTVTVSEAVSLTANFEEIVVTATLKDERENNYNVTLNAFAGEINQANVEAKLLEKYPYIEFGNEAVFNATTNTYSNRIVLPFKVSNSADPSSDNLWHNIYYPSNNKTHSGYPNYIAALNEDEVVDMAESPDYAYGANPTYNTMEGNPSISWAIYNVNDSFEFIFKHEITNKYIKVESVVNATGNTQNVKFVENAKDATAFTLLKDTGSYNGDYALVAKVGDATGYLCATSSNTNYVTHFDHTNHQGAWAKFAEADYEELVTTIGGMLDTFFVPGNNKCVQTVEIQAINEAFGTYENPTSGTILLNTLKSGLETIADAINNWPLISVSATEGGSVTINNESVSGKKAPVGHPLPIVATPAEGYSFVNWTKDAEVVSTDAECTYTVEGATTLTANFAKNSYTVKVTAGEGGSASASDATVKHGSEVTLTATPSTGYSFAGWYDGETLKSAEASYTFTVTSHIDYTARFNEVPTGTVAIHITVASTDDTTVTNNATGNVKAIINNIGQEWATDADFVVGADVELVATNDYDQKGYLFDGWYKSGVLVSNDLEITVQATETATYEARFSKGCTVTANSNNNRFGYISSITLADGTSIGYDASSRAVVKAGTTVKINTFINMYGYEVGCWTNANDEIVSTDKDFIVEVNEDVTYTANFEPASYQLTVRVNNDGWGTVSATSGTSTGTNIKVGHNMEATITATANTGYRFVNWTKGTEVVSKNATYTIPGIANVEDMVDVEYIANFVEADALDAGYYRIAYDFPVAAAAAKSAATRAAGDVTYAITPATGTATLDGDKRTSSWSFTTNEEFPAGLTLKATYTIINDNVSETKTIKAIQVGNSFVDLRTGGLSDDGVGNYNNVTFTLSVQNSNYRIVGYDIKSYITSSYIKFIPTGESLVKDKVYGERFEPTTEHSFSFESDIIRLVQLDYFNVYIQEVGGGETPEPEPETVRYYMQSVACGVSGGNNLQNALKMTQETGAASIFYYTSNKLMSYATGTYVNENGGTRGLQNVGVEGGDVTFESNKIKFTNGTNEAYLHAVINQNGTSYVDHCGSNPDNHAANHNFVLEEVESLPVTITDAGYATWYAPVAVQLPEGLTAYTITIHGDYAITGEGFKQVPANTGVILEGTKGTTYELEIIDSAPEVKSIMEGTVAATYFPENDYAYVLSTDKGTRKLGFYMAKDGAASWSHKAYLPKSAIPADAQMSAGFRLILPGTTAVENVEMRNEKEEIYDLTGRKLEGISGTGIYIINGKKVMVK